MGHRVGSDGETQGKLQVLPRQLLVEVVGFESKLFVLKLQADGFSESPCYHPPTK